MNMRKYFELGMLELLDRKYIDDITIGELISEVGSCKGTFYKHYIDKYDLCCDCFKHHLYCDVTFDAKTWDEFAMSFLTKFEQNPRVVVHAFESSDCNSVRKYHEEMTLKFLTDVFVKNGGKITSDINKMSLEFCVTSITEITLKWLKGGRKESKEEIIELLRAVMPQSIYAAVYGA